MIYDAIYDGVIDSLETTEGELSLPRSFSVAIDPAAFDQLKEEVWAPSDFSVVELTISGHRVYVVSEAKHEEPEMFH